MFRFRKFAFLAFIAALQIGAAGSGRLVDCRAMMAAEASNAQNVKSPVSHLFCNCCKHPAEATKILPTIVKTVATPEPLLFVASLLNVPVTLGHTHLTHNLLQGRGPPSAIGQLPVLRI